MENSVGAVCNRLSSDVLSIQKLTGIQLGIICETLTILFFALIPALIFNRQIGLIFISCVLIALILIYINVKVQMSLDSHYKLLLEQASSVSYDCAHLLGPTDDFYRLITLSPMSRSLIGLISYSQA